MKERQDLLGSCKAAALYQLITVPAVQSQDSLSSVSGTVITIVMERDNTEITIQRIFKEHFLFVLTNFDGQEACHSIKIHLDG